MARKTTSSNKITLKMCVCICTYRYIDLVSVYICLYVCIYMCLSWHILIFSRQCVCHDACLEVRGQLCRVSSPLTPLFHLYVGPGVELRSSGLRNWYLYPPGHLLGPRTNFVLSQIPMTTLAGSSTTVFALCRGWSTCKLLSLCFPPCQLRMPLCQLCGSL